MRLSPPRTHFPAVSSEAMRIKSLAQGHDILMPGVQPSISVSRSGYSNHMTNMLNRIWCVVMDILTSDVLCDDRYDKHLIRCVTMDMTDIGCGV